MRTLTSALALTGALLAPALVSNPANALLPEPQCEVVLDTGALVSFPWPNGNSVIVWPNLYVGSLVTYDWLGDDGTLHGVMQHCTSDSTLTWSMPLDTASPVMLRVEQMLTSAQTFTFAEVAQELQGLGARARIARSGPGRCACAFYGR
ncbi:hypothetical protein [Pararhodobacter sp.]|uniref:hypothetical protein n=1 Tax=Pararhodobacter sp. TaxID=2127056 RepID=UPI002B00258F|nr:hypothetical protein [Pararhodobacter sp.]